jgi:uncharacterized membrane protein
MAPRLLRSARLRPRLLIATGVAILLFALLPFDERLTTRILFSWDAGILLYLVLAAVMMLHSSVAKMRDRAEKEDEGAIAVLVLTLGAAVASLAAIAAELSGIHSSTGREQAIRLGLAALTILCSWFFVNLMFAVHYAHDYYGDSGRRQGLVFPGEDQPDYIDFLYFSFTIGAASQTSDVTIGSRRMRRLVLGHTVLAFLFNTTILALGINVGAGLL